MAPASERDHAVTAHFVEKEDGTCALLASACPICHTTFFPAQAGCSNCGSFGAMQQRWLGETGCLIEATVCHMAPTGYTAPYILGLVRVEENVEFFSIIDTPIDSYESAVGQQVRLRVRPVGHEPNGAPIVGWIYEPSS